MSIKDCHAVAFVWAIYVTQTDRQKTGIIVTFIIRLHNFNFNNFITRGNSISMDKKISYTQLDCLDICHPFHECFPAIFQCMNIVQSHRHFVSNE
jgi:hypothetical protein